MSRFFCGMLFFLVGLLSHAQNNDKDVDDEVDLVIDSLFDEESDQEVDDLLEALFKEQKELEDLMNTFSKFNFLYVSGNYTSDTYFGGRDIGISEYNFRPQITYINGKGFFGGISGVYYEGDYFDPKWNFTSFSAGYGRGFGKDKLVRLSGSYTYYLYSKAGANPLNNNLSVGVSLRNKKRTLGTRFSLNESFGRESLFQVSWSGFGVINMINKKKYRLQFRPRFAFLWAQQTAYYDSGETEIIEEEGVFYEIIKFNEDKVFDLMNIQLNFPLLFSTKKWDVELGFNTNLPYEIGEMPSQKNNNFFNLSVGYLLDL